MVIAIIAVLAALLLPALSSAKKRAQRTTCLNNLQQLNLGARMYADDLHDAPPSPGTAAAGTNTMLLYSGYKELMKNDVGLKGASSPQDKLFACPADVFFPSFFLTNATWLRHYVSMSFHDQPFSDFSNYVFNGGNNVIKTNKLNNLPVPRPGLTGVKLSSVKHPSRTALSVEGPAPGPWSWHDPTPYVLFNDAKNLVGFVDGHVSYIKIYWNTNLDMTTCGYNPPAGYDYKWSGD